jgi:hypothetical protein
MEELKDLEFLAAKSKELLDKQVASYRLHQSNSGTIITILALFIPFFLKDLSDSYTTIKIIALLPVGFLLWAIISLIQVLRSRPLFQGANFDKIEELVNANYEEILLNEIGANKDSFNDNLPIADKSNNKYNFAIKLTLIAIITSTCLLLSNQVFEPETEPTKVTLINSKMAKQQNERNIESRSAAKPTQAAKPCETIKPARVVPVVTAQYRVMLSEGVKPSSDSATDKKKKQ